MNIKKMITVGVAGMAMGAMALDNVEVTDVKARQRYPWNGLVDIDFALGSKMTEPYLIQVDVFDNDGKTNLPIRNVFMPNVSVSNNPCVVRADASRIVWDAAADLPNGFKCTNMLVSARVQREEREGLYCVVDLADGSKEYLNALPSGGWTDVHKKNKMVFRRIEAGSFMMGSPENEPYRRSNETRHKVTLTKPYYIGVFEVTESQYARVTGGSSASTKPQFLEYSELESFRQKMSNALHVVNLKLPTEAQWEMACRGGTTSGLYNGFEASDSALALIARYDGNTSDGRGDISSSDVTYVGCYHPNMFGLYDMLGNAQEWCNDGWDDELGEADISDPEGNSSSSMQVARGGGFVAGRAFCSMRKGETTWNVKLYGVSNACLQSCRGPYRLGISKNGIALMKTIYHELLMKKIAFLNYGGEDVYSPARHQALVAGLGTVYEMNGLRFAWIIE